MQQTQLPADTNSAPPLKPKNKGGRPRHERTSVNSNRVKELASIGMPQAQIGIAVKIDAKTLRKYYKPELCTGMVEANEKVLYTLFNMATSGKCPAATIFWAKTHCGLGTVRPPAPEPEQLEELEPAEGGTADDEEDEAEAAADEDFQYDLDSLDESAHPRPPRQSTRAANKTTEPKLPPHSQFVCKHDGTSLFPDVDAFKEAARKEDEEALKLAESKTAQAANKKPPEGGTRNGSQ